MKLAEYDLEAMVEAIRKGRLRSQDLVKTYISRIDEVNEQVLAVGVISKDAHREAIELDQQDKKDSTRLLHGIPILVKDVFATRDCLPITGGSFALSGSKLSREATIITRLRDAGAILLGKTNLSEWGNSRLEDAPHGWSPIYGQCKGAFHENQDPNGSSSGSAVAMSLNLAAATIGAETFGSITYPAQRNSVVGLKPTVGLVSRAGVIPINKYQDSVGPITRTVKDAAIILSVIAGRDKLDESTESIPFENIPAYHNACSSQGLEGAFIAIPPAAVKLVRDPEVLSAFRDASAVVKSLGATIKLDVEFKTWKADADLRDETFSDALLREGLEEYFKKLEQNPNNIHTVPDLVKFTEDNPSEENSKYGCDWLQNASQSKLSSGTAELNERKEGQENLGKEIEELLDRYECDAIMVPTSTNIPYDLGGNPGISVPLGFYSKDRLPTRNKFGAVLKGPNIPFSLMFVGRRFSEQKLIKFAYAFEQATMVYKKNKLIIEPTSDIIDIGGPISHV